MPDGRVDVSLPSEDDQSALHGATRRISYGEGRGAAHGLCVTGAMVQ